MHCGVAQQFLLKHFPSFPRLPCRRIKIFESCASKSRQFYSKTSRLDKFSERRAKRVRLIAPIVIKLCNFFFKDKLKKKEEENCSFPVIINSRKERNIVEFGDDDRQRSKVGKVHCVSFVVWTMNFQMEAVATYLRVSRQRTRSDWIVQTSGLSINVDRYRSFRGACKLSGKTCFSMLGR